MSSEVEAPQIAEVDSTGGTSSEWRNLTRLALPIIGANVGWMALQLVDTIMVGKYSSEALAAVAIAGVWISGTLFLGVGLVMGLDPIITNAHGARDGERAGRAIQSGIVVALVIGAVICGLWAATERFLVLGGQDPALSRVAQTYANAQMFSVPLFLVYTALRQYLQGREIVRPIMWLALVANAVNALLNWVFIFGHLGVPELGAQGAGIATGLTRAFMFLSLILVMRWGRLHQGAWVPWSRMAVSARGLWEVLRHGLPIGLQFSLEIWAFGAASLMAGKLGQVALASHAIVLNLASISFMFPLGVAAAATTRVGNLLGSGRPQRAQHSAWVAFAMGAMLMAVAGLVFATLRHELPTVYTKGSDVEVRELCAVILPIAAAFQVFDGVQVVGSGILRGMGQTLPAAWINLIGYWVLALPLAYWITFELEWGLAGVWWGLALGLALVAGALLAWVRVKGPSATARAASVPT